jgi:4-hydroxythreonine-4-phosphate dehydrogenase
MRGDKPRIAVLLGDPSGIGPEVAGKVLAMPETLQRASVLVIGDPKVCRTAADAGIEFLACPAPGCPVGSVSAEAGAYTIGTLRVAVESLRSGRVDGVVYAPLNKQAMKVAGLGFDDELHFFASLLGHTGVVSEINVCGGLWTSRVTSHVALRDVARLITREKIRDAAGLLHRTLVAAGVAAPRIAVAGLNPHAGEGGLMGTEELDTIGPAVEELRAAGVDAIGPLPADTLFVAARRGDFHGVVTMYHDQGQIAMKLLGFERGVTVAGGLPAVITTPAHGTAYDIVGRGVADPGAMREAFRLACKMACEMA